MSQLIGDSLDLPAGELPRTVRVFPLPDHVLLPDLPTSYRIFEPRYRKLLEDLLELPEEERWIGIPRSSPQGMGETVRPGFEPVATIGRVMGATHTSGGDYLVVVQGVFRARLVEEPSDNPYSQAAVEPLPDDEERPSSAARARYATVLQLFSALRPYLKEKLDPISEAVRDARDISTAIYRIASVFVVDPDDRQVLLETRSVERRAAMVEDALAMALAVAAGQEPGQAPPS